MYKRKENGDPTIYFHEDDENVTISLDPEEDPPVWLIQKDDMPKYFANQMEEEPNVPPDYGIFITGNIGAK